MSAQGLSIAAIATGGAFGALLRYGVQSMFLAVAPSFPAGTLVVNLCGSLAIGLLLPVVDQWSELARPFLVVGFLGGLTTMSSFSAEIALLVKEQRYAAAGLHWAGGAVGCIVVAMLGLYAGARAWR